MAGLSHTAAGGEKLYPLDPCEIVPIMLRPALPRRWRAIGHPRTRDETAQVVSMEPMSVLLTVWGILTTVLMVLLIYRSALARHEDDELFLTNAEAQFEEEQKELTARMNRLRPYLNALAASSGLLLLVMAGLWVWRGWTRM
jgi:hypothetical protein